MKGSLRTIAVVLLAIALAVGLSSPREAAAGDRAATGALASQAQVDSPPPGEQSAGQLPTATAKKGGASRVKRVLRRLNPIRLLREHEYKKAASAFPAFCKHWQSLLHERETYNLSQIKWLPKDGYQTATYTGYGNIQSCTCEQSPGGFAIGKLTYDEFEYYIAGKTIDEARRAKPRPVVITVTTELFRWDHGKWFY
jgi:hypothetical protein